jgi:hypothetical protein
MVPIHVDLVGERDVGEEVIEELGALVVPRPSAVPSAEE